MIKYKELLLNHEVALLFSFCCGIGKCPVNSFAIKPWLYSHWQLRFKCIILTRCLYIKYSHYNGTCKPVMMSIPGISVGRRREGWCLQKPTWSISIIDQSISSSTNTYAFLMAGPFKKKKGEEENEKEKVKERREELGGRGREATHTPRPEKERTPQHFPCWYRALLWTTPRYHLHREGNGVSTTSVQCKTPYVWTDTVQSLHSTVWSRRLALPYGTEGSRFVLQFDLGAAVQGLPKKNS